MALHKLAYLLVLAFTFAGLGIIFWSAQKSYLRPLRNLPYPVIALVLLGAVIFEFLAFKVGVQASGWDFLQAYYPAGQAMLHNDVERLRILIGDSENTAAAIPGMAANPNLFVNIPIFAYALVPFAMLPPQSALMLFTATGIALVFLAWCLLVKVFRLETRERWLLALLFMANGPLLYGIIIGNLSYFILAALAGAFLLLRSGRFAAAGAILGVAAVIKPPLALFGLFFILRRDVRGLSAFAALGIGVVLLSLVRFGWAYNLHWFEACIVQFSHEWMAAYNVQSFAGFMLRLGKDAQLMQWSAVVPSPTQKLIANMLTAMIFLVGLIACIRWPKIGREEGLAAVALRCAPVAETVQRQELAYLLIICMCLVLSPLTWSHYYVWLLMPMAYFLAKQDRLPLPARIAGWLAIALVTPVQLDPTAVSNTLLGQIYKSLLVSHYFFGGLLWFGLMAWWLCRSGGWFTPRNNPQIVLGDADN